MKTEEILDKLETIGEKVTDRIVWETVLYYNASIALSIPSIRKQLKDNTMEQIIFYGIVLGDSGSGKSFVEKSVAKLFPFTNYTDFYIKYLEHYYEQMNDEGWREEKEEDMRFLPKDALVTLKVHKRVYFSQLRRN